MKKAAKCLLWIGILAALATPAFAETRTISWDPVTTYTDNTPIEAGKTVTYSAYWTTDPGLGSLHTLGTSLTTTSTTFDPTVQGMTRGGTVYFTAKAVLNTGEESALSPAYAWVVPVVTPPPATLTSVSGERSVVGERERYRDVHGDGYVGQRDDGGDHPDVERELVVRDDQLRRRADGVGGDVEPGGDGDGDLRRPHRHEERDDRRRAGRSDQPSR